MQTLLRWLHRRIIALRSYLHTIKSNWVFRNKVAAKQRKEFLSCDRQRNLIEINKPTRLPQIKSQYGFVQYIGSKLPFKTLGYDASSQPGLPNDPEGNIFYSFTKHNRTLPIRTRMDAVHFSKHPNLYRIKKDVGNDQLVQNLNRTLSVENRPPSVVDGISMFIENRVNNNNWVDLPQETRTQYLSMLESEYND